MSLLDEILAEKHSEAASLTLTQSARAKALPPRDVVSALARPPGARLRIIAEVKFRSPSAGPLSRTLSAADRALAYEEAGASMVSVLTDARFFDGSFEHLADARGRVHLPLLCKDFIVSPAQVDAAWAKGACAVLVIVRCLQGASLVEIVEAVRTRGLEPFVEVTNEAELERAIDVGARLIGVNARDLDTLAMDRARAARVLDQIPKDVVAVHLSGLKTPEDAREIAASRADAALVGEALMREDDPIPLLRAMVRAGSSP